MKELTKVYGDLLQDKRVRSEQSKYETLTRQRNTAMSKYKKSYKAFKELMNGLSQAQAFYMQMGESVDNLNQNVETFVNNRRSEGAQLLSQIERDKALHASGQEDREREKLQSLMERLSMEPTPTSTSPKPRPQALKMSSQHGTPSGSKSPIPQYPSTTSQIPSYPPYPPTSGRTSVDPYGQFYGAPTPVSAPAPGPEGYNPMAYLYQPQASPAANQQYFNPSQPPYGTGYPTSPPIPGPGQPHTPQYMHGGYVPPPPPPRPATMGYGPPGAQYPPAGGYPMTTSMSQGAGRPQQGQQQPGQGQGAQNDPWAGLSAWK